MAHGLAEIADIDWAAPWLGPYRAVGQLLADKIEHGASCASALNSVAASGQLRFVPQDELPAGASYESFTFQSRSVPTRDGLHDFFNGLVWHHFPQSKQALNRVQAEQIQRSGLGPVRGAVRDAVTVFDENAALLRAPDILWEALAKRQWHRLFGELRPLWQESHLILFGHALLEKLVTPRKAITAHVLRISPPSDHLPDIDDWLADHLDVEVLKRKPYRPLPVLGVPGWWPANAEADFYADTEVFRAARDQV
ncbi:MAG: DUF3025 domain-containing protein [Hylemonella sp.]